MNTSSKLLLFLSILSIGFLFYSCETEEQTPDVLQIIKKEKISGFVQKGPFVSGTNILMNELNSELVQTGKIFTSTITNDMGLFELNNIELNSRYVEFTSSGFYFNEVSGEISISPITLSSLSDIRDRNSINVNVLTHLEKRRVETLLKEGKSFSESKKQSRGELLSFFSMSLNNDSSFEEFDISKNTEEGRILLAISIILQGKRSVGQLTELLSRIQNDFGNNGKLDDENILNSLRSSTLSLNFKEIRKNIENRFKELNNNSPLPDFENQLSKFLSFRDYPLTITIEGGGTVEEKIITNPAGREYPYGTIVELKPVPEEGWVFDSFEGDLTGNTSPQNITIDKEKNVTVKFKRKDYLLNITIIGEGTVEEKVITNPSGRQYPFQTVVELKPVPEEGWVFDSFEGDLTGNTSPQNITIDKEKNVTVKFKRRDYPLNITIIGVGTVEEKVITNPSGRQYPFQTVVELKPVPKAGWVFDSFEGDLTGNTSPQNITVDKEKNVTVRFIEEPRFYLHENGITCVCENVKVGEKGFINGIEYEAVDNNLIRERKDEGADMSKLCTSMVTRLDRLFYEKQFNQPIGNWDVSNVEDMNYMFYNSLFNQDISNWDVGKVTNMAGMFNGSPFNHSIGAWDVSNVRNMSYMFSDSQFNKTISSWNVSNVTDMSFMFGRSSFNQAIGNWNVNKVTNMKGMFSHTQFNQTIGKWNVSEVTDMSSMFAFSQFNLPIGDWDVSKVTNMYFMFFMSQFNKPLGEWDVSKVTNMREMFSNSFFNQPINNWDVSNVRDMTSMFSKSNFNQAIPNWDVSNVTDMRLLFQNSKFNQPIGNWDVSNVTNMYGMFWASQFNQNIENWDVSNVTDMRLLFFNSEFNQPIGNWNVSKVTSMNNMFYHSQFNQAILSWDVSNVKDMSGMFAQSAFNYPISDWNVENVKDMNLMFANSIFNQNINDWNVSNVTNMYGMFGQSAFNYSISDWNVSQVTNMNEMFSNSKFNQNISSWCVSNISSEPKFFSYNSPLKEQNKPKWGTCPNN